jgi:hypothetical protein
MIRKQFSISEEMARRLKQESSLCGVAESEFVRRALERYLESASDERAQILSSLIGAFGDTNVPRDLAEEHDKYLYGSEQEEL